MFQGELPWLAHLFLHLCYLTKARLCPLPHNLCLDEERMNLCSNLLECGFIHLDHRVKGSADVVPTLAAALCILDLAGKAIAQAPSQT